MRVHAILAAFAGLALRLFFILKFPTSDSGDAPFYIELAWNWLKNGVYGFPVNGRLTAVDMRVPGYPAFLAAIFAFAGNSPRAVMFAQVVVDLATCFLIALIAARLAPEPSRRRVATAGLWLAALCPFVANYTAVVLTEILVVFLTALAMLLLFQTELGGEPRAARLSLSWRWFLGGVIVGFGALVRPETPLLLMAAGLVLIVKWRAVADWPRLLRVLALLGVGLVLPLVPWAARNWRTFHEVQFLSPRYSELPGEFAPVGFDAWTRTWMWRYRDVYLTTWKLDEEAISPGDIPPSAYDTPQEQSRVSDWLQDYNDTLTLSRSQDRELAEIARERTARHPLRTYVKIPLLRSLTNWFTPRVELLPFSGKVWPLREKWQDDSEDVLVTLTLVVLNCFFFGLAIAGAWIARHRPGLAFLIAFVLLRTVFFAYFAEAPEPRYVLECFPAVLALGAQVWSRSQLSSTGSG